MKTRKSISEYFQFETIKIIPIQLYSNNGRLARTKFYSSSWIAISVNTSDWYFKSNKSVRKCVYLLKSEKCIISLKTVSDWPVPKIYLLN